MAKQFRERVRVLINCNAPPSYSGRFGFIESRSGQFSWKVRFEGSDQVVIFHEDEIDEVIEAPKQRVRDDDDACDGALGFGPLEVFKEMPKNSTDTLVFRRTRPFRHPVSEIYGVAQEKPADDCGAVRGDVEIAGGIVAGDHASIQAEIMRAAPPPHLKLRFNQLGERVVRLPGIEPVPDPYRAHVEHDRGIAKHLKGLLEYAHRSLAAHPAALNFGVDIGRPGGDQSAASFFGSGVEVEAIQAVLERYVRLYQCAPEVPSRLGVLRRLGRVIYDLTSEDVGATPRFEPEPGPESGKTG